MLHTLDGILPMDAFNEIISMTRVDEFACHHVGLDTFGCRDTIKLIKKTSVFIPFEYLRDSPALYECIFHSHVQKHRV